MNNRVRSLLSSLLLACFSVFIIPNELVHSLYGHTDTKHDAVQGAARSIGEQHIHCAFLTYEAAPFHQTAIQETPVPFTTDIHSTVATFKSEYVAQLELSSLRGPPAC